MGNLTKVVKPNFNHILNMAKTNYLQKLNLIHWNAAKWMQFKEYTYIEENDIVSFHFKSSSYGIGFTIEVKAFSIIYGKPYFENDYLYNYFKKIKYSEYTGTI